MRDPQVLERFALERVLAQIITTGKGGARTPLELLQRMFDIENTREAGAFADNPHCDDTRIRPDSADGARTFECPRAEGRLARSDGLLRPGDPDFFAPVAVVNRFDLMPGNSSSCGEYRIVYAKSSGLTNPEDRVMLIIEGALENPSHELWGCMPIAETWAGLSSASSMADTLDRLFFSGVDGFRPVVHADHYGLRTRNGCEYSGSCGQFRVGQGMQAPWRFRQFRLQNAWLDLAVDVRTRDLCEGLCLTEVRTTSTPHAALFDTESMGGRGAEFRSTFVGHAGDLTTPDLARVQFPTLEHDEAFESAVEGPAQPSFSSQVGDSDAGMAFKLRIGMGLANIESRETRGCPADDPLTPDDVLRRAMASTCAGCHAPQVVLGADRDVGCGQVWPESLGRVHIDERGSLSDALTRTFLPYRASVFTTYLQGCDEEAVRQNLIASRVIVAVECLAAGTLITLADGSQRPIEHLVAGDSVLAFDEVARTLVAAQVERALVRHEVDRLIVINDTLLATPNHQFYTSNGRKRAQSLAVGDPLYQVGTGDAARTLGADLTVAHVERLAERAGGVTTYNLQVAVHHNYFAGGVLVSDTP